MRTILHFLGVAGGAVFLTLAFFLVLPLMQTIASRTSLGTVLPEVDAASLPPPPPPPPPPEPEQPPEPEEPEEPPEAEPPPLTLDQLELALSDAFESDWSGAAAYELDLDTVGKGGEGGAGALFSLDDLDQGPRPTYQPMPTMDAQMRKAAPATVWLLFIVDEQGRVVSPRVQRSTDPLFERAALNAVEKWKYEPGMKGGQPARSRIRQPITFPEP